MHRQRNPRPNFRTAMRPMLRRALCLLLALAMTLAAPATAASDGSDIIFLALNDAMPYTLAADTMPYWSGGALYVHSTVFDITSLNLSASYNAGNMTLLLYSGSTRRSLTFFLSEGYVQTPVSYTHLQVLHNRSVQMAKRYHVDLEVLTSFSHTPGTIVKEVVKMEKVIISGVAKDKSIARIALVGLNNEPGVAYHLFELLAKKNIDVDIILQSIGRGESKDISFTVDRGDCDAAVALLEENKAELGFDHVNVRKDVAKVSIVGGGMLNTPGIAATMFQALYEDHINIHMITTSEIKISVLIDEDKADRAVQAIHAKFFE